MSRNRDDFDMTQQEVADVTGMSQQNVNDAQVKGMKKARSQFLDYYTLEEIRSYLRHAENR